MRGRNFGLRMAAELWYEPSRDSLVVGDLSLSTIGTSRAARIGYGWRIAEQLFTDGVYIGPESQYFASDNYWQNRVGLHITSMKTDTTEWSAGVGWARDSDGRSSPYVRLNLSKKIAD